MGPKSSFLSFGGKTSTESHENLQGNYDGDVKAATLRISQITTENAERQITLAEMSKKLYGVDNFSAKKSIWPTVGWILAMLMVAGVEIPLNQMSFEIFDRSQTETRIMAYVFGGLIGVLAHFTGYGFKRAYIEKKSSLLSYTCLGIAILAFSTTANFRMQYIEMLGLENSMTWGDQFSFASIIFFIGVVICFYKTTSVKDLNLEKVFRSELEVLNSLEKEKQMLLKKREELRQNLTTALTEKTSALEKGTKEMRERREEEEKERTSNFSNALAKANHELTKLEIVLNRTPKEEWEENDTVLTQKSQVEAWLKKATENTGNDENSSNRLREITEKFTNLLNPIV